MDRLSRERRAKLPLFIGRKRLEVFDDLGRPVAREFWSLEAGAPVPPKRLGGPQLREATTTEGKLQICRDGASVGVREGQHQ